MKVLEESLQRLEKRVKNLETRISKIPDPFVILYRPPNSDYVKLNEALDALFNRLNNMENFLAGVEECQQQQNKEVQ